MGYSKYDKPIACIAFPPFTQPRFSGFSQIAKLCLSFAFRLHPFFCPFRWSYLSITSSAFFAIRFFQELFRSLDVFSKLFISASPCGGAYPRRSKFGFGFF
jgi:hypothetical protein